MRICYVCADSGVSLSKHNGSAAHVRAIVAAFGALGHEVELLLADVDGAEAAGVAFRPIPRPAFARSLGSVGRRMNGGDAIDVATTASLRALRRLWINPGLEHALNDSIERFDPDLVYERHSPFSVAGPIVAGRHRCPHILEVNAPLAWEGARHRGQAMTAEAELLERMAFAAATRIVAVSDELRDQLVESGVDPNKIRVVPNGVDVGRFADVRPEPAGQFDGKLVVGFVGSLKAWHGIETLTAAFESLAPELPNLHLLIVGDGPLAGHVEAFAARLPGRVTWTGAVPQEQVPGRVAAMDIAVAPYPNLDRFYFSPLKVLEYMAAGRAIVASGIGQLERLVADGTNGLLVEPGSVSALAAAIRQLATDREMRRQLGAQAGQDAIRGHAWTRRAADILKLVRQAAA